MTDIQSDNDFGRGFANDHAGTQATSRGSIPKIRDAGIGDKSAVPAPTPRTDASTAIDAAIREYAQRNAATQEGRVEQGTPAPLEVPEPAVAAPSPQPLEDVIVGPRLEVISRLTRIQIGGCTCDVKHPDLDLHAENCHYRLAAEAENLLYVPSPQPSTAVAWGDPYQLPDGRIFKVGTSTGVGQGGSAGTATPKYKYAKLLNQLYDMQDSIAYAARRSTLVDAESAIVSLERELAAAREERDAANIIIGQLEVTVAGQKGCAERLYVEGIALRERAEKAEAALAALRKRLEDAAGELPPHPVTENFTTPSEHHKVFDAYIDNLRSAVSAKIAALTARLAELHERLEDNVCFDLAGNRIEVEAGSIPDGITCRDETIKLQDAAINGLEAKLAEFEQDALRYRWMRNVGHTSFELIAKTPYAESPDDDELHNVWKGPMAGEFMDKCIDSAIDTERRGK